jgi:nucleotide-binding universal stress UspA family protein
MGFALDLARQADGTVTLFHAIEWLAEEEPRAHANIDVAEYRRFLVEDALTGMRTLIGHEAQGGGDIAPQVALGRAYRKILDVAESEAFDLIVMGAQGRGGVRLAVFGSTTQQVVRGAPCPVLTVRGPAAAGNR